MIKNRFLIVIEVIQHGIYNVYDIKQDKWLLSKESSQSKSFEKMFKWTEIKGNYNYYYFYRKNNNISCSESIAIPDALLITNSLLVVAVKGPSFSSQLPYASWNISNTNHFCFYNLSNLLSPTLIGNDFINSRMSTNKDCRLCLLSYNKSNPYDINCNCKHEIAFAMIYSGYERNSNSNNDEKVDSVGFIFSHHEYRIDVTITEIKNVQRSRPANLNFGRSINSKKQIDNSKNDHHQLQFNTCKFKIIKIYKGELGIDYRGCYSSRIKIGLFCLRNEWNHPIIVDLGGIGFKEITTTNKRRKSQKSLIQALCSWIMVANLVTRKKDYFDSVCLCLNCLKHCMHL